MLYLVHFLYAFLLFLASNWIGKHSFSLGYVSASMNMGGSERPAFDLVYKVLGPTLAVVLFAAICFEADLDTYTEWSWQIVAFYIGIRAVVILAIGRVGLVDWRKQLFYWLASLVVAYFAHTKLVVSKTLMLPSIESLSEELWILIILFCYELINRIEVPTTSRIQRRTNYVRRAYEKFEDRYSAIVESEIEMPELRDIAYAIMVHENHNRSPLLRAFERIWVTLSRRPTTQGVMQVRSASRISDAESVRLGSIELRRELERLQEDWTPEDGSDSGLGKPDGAAPYFHDLLRSYNACDDYVEEIARVLRIVDKSPYY